MHAEPLAANPPSPMDVVSVSYSAGVCDVIVEASSRERWLVHFEGAEGLRILDEGDLMEFWPECSSRNGWLFRIHSGGWRDQECNRPGFILRETKPNLPEYFVAGENACVSVLSHTPPEVSPCQE